MDKTPLVSDDIDAGQAFINRMNAYAPVKAAFWLRDDEGGERYLYLALEGLTTDKIDEAYQEVLRATGEIGDHDIYPFRVRLIKVDDPLARAVLDLYHQFPGRKRPPFYGSALGGVPVGEIYIYPQLSAKQ